MEGPALYHFLLDIAWRTIQLHSAISLGLRTTFSDIAIVLPSSRSPFLVFWNTNDAIQLILESKPIWPITSPETRVPRS
jgi:hypothetical protein